MPRRRIGVFVCHCGNNIGGVVRVPEVVEYARRLPNVVYAEGSLYACSEEGLSSMKEKITAYGLNRVVVASCTPRTHETLFRNACEEAGLNRYLFEFVNIREHCSWIHMRAPDQATEKAKSLIKMGVAKSYYLEPQEELESEVYPEALVIGGGVTGMTAALNLAHQGLKVHLVEWEKELGGLLSEVNKLFLAHRDSKEILDPLVEGVKNHPLVTIYLGSEVEGVEGFIGNFKVRITKVEEEIKVGTIIVATGARELKPTGQYGYPTMANVLTQLELEARLKERVGEWQSVVMINCVGARVADRSYCGRFCCLTAMKNAILIKERNPQAKIYILHQDVMASGVEAERYYRGAMELGVRFIRYDLENPPQVLGDGRVEGVKVYHALIGREVTLPAQLVVLTTPLAPQADNERLSKMLKVPLGSEGFFLEAHLKLRPIEFATDGVYLCGSARHPSDIRESVSQAYAASAKAAIPMREGVVRVEAITAFSQERLCNGCGNCLLVCPFGAVELKDSERGAQVAWVSVAQCKGCGCCVAACPNGAMQQRGFSDQQLLTMIEALAEGVLSGL
jgi:heterodisulfide reductase subunit A